jgi:hypothetical protein
MKLIFKLILNIYLSIFYKQIAINVPERTIIRIGFI